MSEQPPAYDSAEKQGPPGGGYPPTGQPQPQPQPGYPPQQQGYPPQQAGGPSQPQQPYYPPPGQVQPPGQTTTVIVTQTAIRSGIPVQITCPTCKQYVTTNVTYETGTITWLACLGIALFGCWLGCCLIPFCVTDLQDAIHTCPSCSTCVGRYNRM